MKIYLDAGHGGKDPGAVGYLEEDKVNLAIAITLGAELQKAGFKIQYSRKEDVTTSIQYRIADANKSKADYFISIHNNSGSSPANGFEIIYCEGADRSKKLAQTVYDNVTLNMKVKGRGIKTDTETPRGRLGVLRDTKMPAILLECGFVTNEQEAKKLKDETYIKEMCKLIVRGITEYTTKIKNGDL